MTKRSKERYKRKETALYKLSKGKGKEGRKEDGAEEKKKKLRNEQKKRAKETMRDWKKEAKKKTGKNGVAGSLRGSKGKGGGTKSDEGNNGGKFYGIASSGNCRVCTAEKDVEILKRGGARVVGEEGRGGGERLEINAVT